VGDRRTSVASIFGRFVSTVGLDENIVRAYIRNQEDEDERYDQMKLEIPQWKMIECSANKVETCSRE
jgi:putative transposase